jgi:hypothetical protein
MKASGRFDRHRRAALVALGIGAATVLAPRLARASGPWGTPPSSVWPTPPDLKVLEIHLYGGVSMWETFYCRAPGAANRFRGFESEIPALNFAGCDPFIDPAPAPFANDALGHPIHFGPATKPLWKPQILDKTRLVVMKHEFQPHEAAIPLTLTGQRLGSPKLAGLGAAIQHHHVSKALLSGSLPADAQPFAYVLLPNAGLLDSDNVRVLSAVGMHPAYARPLTLKVSDSLAAELALFPRTGLRSQRDALLQRYVDQYSAALRHPSMVAAAPPGRTRSAGFGAFEFGTAMVMGAPSLHSMLTDPTSPASQPIPVEADCPDVFPSTFANTTAQSIKLAAYLLSRTGSNAPRYVGVVDSGMRQTNGAAYDTHGSDNHGITALNLYNVCKTLRTLVDAGTLNLANTMVVLSTEFGRTPQRTGSSGRDHWPEGFCHVLIGGPVTRGISGALYDANFSGTPAGLDGYAAPGDSFTPQDMRAAVLTACGILPFENELYGVSDISLTGATHEDLMHALKSRVLGV